MQIYMVRAAPLNSAVGEGNMFVTFFVRVLATPHSRHRSPEGVYKVQVRQSMDSLEEQAREARQVAFDHIPFLHENMHCSTISVFSERGNEIRIKDTFCDDISVGLYCGRAETFPEHLTMM